MFDFRMITVTSVNVWCFKSMKRQFTIGIGLYILLGWLSSIGSPNGLNGICVAAKIDCPSSAEMIESLKPIGFAFSEMDSEMQVKPYVPMRTKEFTPDANPFPSPVSAHTTSGTPSYKLKYSGQYIRFQLLNYSSPAKIMANLEELQKIAVIKTRTAYIVYPSPISRPHWQSLLILSRVINIFDCRRLNVSVASNLGVELNQAQLVECQEEAQHVIRHASYTAACRLNIRPISTSTISSLADSGVFLLRPISSMLFKDKEFLHAHLLKQLPLTSSYTLFFECLPAKAYIVLDLSQKSSSQCRRITIAECIAADITFVGLEDAIANHPALTLMAPWPVLLHMGEHNPVQIKVNTLLGLDVSPESYQLMINAPQKDSPAKSQLITNHINSTIITIMTCKPLDYYAQLYTTSAFAKYGIVAKRVQLSYEGERDDLCTTLNLFVSVGALWRLPIEVSPNAQDHIVCCGNELSTPGWKLQSAVDIKLDMPDLSNILARYKQRCSPYFCQNICYSTINIRGSEAPRPNYVNDCMTFLDLFLDITADQLKLENIHDARPALCNFEIPRLEQEMLIQPKLRLNVQTIVLNSVDVRILYRMLGRYDFSRKVEVSILNQQFSNLAIARVLSLPVAQQISAITINDFFELNEVTHYDEQDEIEGFSLLKHVDLAIQEGKTLQTLGLHKLHMRLAIVDFLAYADALRRLLSYGIQLLDMPFDLYMESISTPLGYAALTDKKVFTLYSVDLIGLENDLSTDQPMSQPQESLVQRQSVERLLLHFSNGQDLTKESFVTIVRWVAYRFKNVVTLQLEDLMSTKDVQNLIRSYNCLIVGLERLSSIELADPDLNRPSIELLSWQYLNSFQVCASNPEPTFIVVPARMIPDLIAYTEYLDKFIPEPSYPMTPFQRVIEDLKRNRQDLDELACDICCRKGYVPPERQENDEPGAKRLRMFVPEKDFKAFCYHSCGKPICNVCVANCVSPSEKCVFCQQTNALASIYQLRSLPPSNFVLAKGTTNTPAASRDWIKKMTWNDGRIYLAVVFKYLLDSDAIVNNGLRSNDTFRIWVI
ncbi:hypothetical protein NEHOM01_2306 [Nematocida homosporus]|uniref:uncharacterized protein n=1 Tax=Nematocida homosporus TaxID=1912981 RepID=UPI002220A895|nr:uncharacterized protein NEHOM01_2306 [Nematocida homosporus]KAI5187604.1 hypothetical protein NEHOM01_2306 [Nematocida homosporus]